MAIIAKCDTCGREGGYAKSAEDTTCARCKKNPNWKPEEEDKENE